VTGSIRERERERERGTGVRGGRRRRWAGEWQGERRILLSLKRKRSG